MQKRLENRPARVLGSIGKEVRKVNYIARLMSPMMLSKRVMACPKASHVVPAVWWGMAIRVAYEMSGVGKDGK